MHVVSTFARPNSSRLFRASSSLSLMSLLLLFAVLFCATAAVRAQYRVRAWTTDDGLPQNTINAVVQTRDGYLWIATFGGLVRFDGVRFKVFNTVNAPALKSLRVTALREDRAGILWIGTETGEISCMRDGEFYPFDDGEAEEINSIFSDTNGYLWAGGWKGARRYRLPESRCGTPVHEFERIKPPPLHNQSSDQISSIIEAADNSFWLINFGVSTEKTGRLLHWRANQPLEVFNPSDDFPETLQSDETRRIVLWDIALSRNGGNNDDGGAKETLWLTDRNGLLRFDGKHFVKELAQTRITTDRFRFATDVDGRLTINLSDELARLSNDGRWETVPVKNIAGKEVRAFFVDRENNFWVGTNAAGLLRLKPSAVESFDESKGVAMNRTAAVLQDSHGRLWVAGYGLRRLENNGFVREKNVPDIYLLSLAELRDGTLLIGGYDGLFARRANGSVDDLTPELKAIFGDSPFAVKAIYEDSNGNLWFGFRDKGLLRRSANGDYTRFTTENGLVGDQVQFIAEAKNGSLWFGAVGGASRLENGQFTNFTTADGLVNDNVRSILETSDGNVYFGTYGGGLSRLKNNRIQTATIRDGLFDDVVSRIISDASDNFWMLGNAGVFTISKSEIDGFFDGENGRIFCRSFGTSDGMLTAEGNGGSQPAGWLARDGRFWFPTIRGYVAITPPAPERFLPPVIIEDVKVNDKIVDARQSVTINPDEQNLEISYTGLGFSRPEQIRFRYKLEGYEENWTQAGTRRTAYYSYPPTGEYVFSVQAANPDGVWNEQSATLKLRILPPFYRTWWFFALTIFCLAAAVYSIYSFRVSRLNRARRVQEVFSRRLIQSQEEERKRIAGDLHDSLSQNLVIIKHRAMISLTERDDMESVFEQIEEIAEAAQESLAEVREIAGNLRPFQIDRLGLTKAVEALVHKANTASLQVTARIGNIDGTLEPEMEINLYRILQEGLNNIIKHSEATRASIEIERSAKTITVTIRDDGKGFDIQNIHRTEEMSRNGGSGLLGIHERARILRTTPLIESNEGSGTSIRLIISIKANASKN